MGWKVRSGKLALVKQTIDKQGGRQQVRWQFAQYKIQEALASRGQTLEAGLDARDFQYLIKQGILIGDAANEMIDRMPELNGKKNTLEAIKHYFIEKDGCLGIEDFLNTYLKLKKYGNGTWKKFLSGKEFIEYEAFKGICTVLDLDCDEIGTEKPEMPDWKQLETLLWKFNHNSEVGRFQDLATMSHNLVRLKLRLVPRNNISLFWLLKALIQPVDGNIKKAEISFSSLTYLDFTDRLNNITTQIFRKQPKKKQNLGDIAKEIHEQMVKDKKTIILYFRTDQEQQLTEFYELFNLLYEALVKELSTAKSQQKLLMVWIDSQAPDEDESEAFDLDRDRDIIPEMSLSYQFNKNDIMEWTKLEAVNKFIQRTRNSDSLNDLYKNNIAEYIWHQSQGKPEVLLESVYSLCNIKWEQYQHLWQKF